ncbi:hypothetical protein GCM10010230_06220 [Streptomyces narbonensis]|nr:hypothetical protein GCM10010230_06220 [Streptomyces narbonensis]
MDGPDPQASGSALHIETDPPGGGVTDEVTDLRQWLHASPPSRILKLGTTREAGTPRPVNVSLEMSPVGWIDRAGRRTRVHPGPGVRLGSVVTFPSLPEGRPRGVWCVLSAGWKPAYRAYVGFRPVWGECVAGVAGRTGR